ncbi:protein-L-isoaspartate(D-aspartate) O-methyltransferase [Candidatus Saccharibacteria bacterium]|nr:protein-L-isoaspartate(D-aspartate) O-methyltransferase [Candidatus Saccharibacteria bacterium]
MKALADAKRKMLEEHLEKRGISDKRVLKAFNVVPREEFVSRRYRDLSYEDMPLEIGSGQTISQPYTVAFMTQLLDPQPQDNVLEVGTGSGYQAAILSRLCRKVYTIERVEELAESARDVLERCGYDNVEVVVGDGSLGLADKAPFDRIVVTAASPRVPRPLVEQLKVGGRLVVPVGVGLQDMVRLTKTRDGEKVERFSGFRFVPLVGEEGFRE